MRHYETIYIVTPDLSDEEVQQVNTKFRSLIEAQKGVVIKLQDWGKQRLAYEIKKQDKGTYILVDFCAEPGLTAELTRSLNLDERILKFQTVKLEDFADPQELLKKEEEKKQKSKPEEEVPALEGDLESKSPSPELEEDDGEEEYGLQQTN